jgi:hypothetical protein
MPQQESWLSDEDRRAALEILADRLGKDIPEAVGQPLDAHAAPAGERSGHCVAP